MLTWQSNRMVVLLTRTHFVLYRKHTAPKSTTAALAKKFRFQKAYQRITGCSWMHTPRDTKTFVRKTLKSRRHVLFSSSQYSIFKIVISTPHNHDS